MPIPCYLALTAAEFANTDPRPEKIAWMACHYSCYGTGLSNMPPQLPEDSIIIFNDRTPPDKHDPQRILAQLSELAAEQKPAGFLLDFQRSGIALNRQLAQILTEGLSCPVAVTAEYARDLCCPVFLEPPPLHMKLADHIAPWSAREIWLEAAVETAIYTVTSHGCQMESAENVLLSPPVFTEDQLLCRYHMTLFDDRAEFTLQRTKEDVHKLLEQAHGITRAIGLYQQFAAENACKV